MGQFTHNGIIYEELPDGQSRVVGYAQGSAVGPVIGGNPKMPFELQSAQGDAAAAPYAAPRAAADLTRTQLQNQAQPLQNENTAVNIQQNRQSMQNQRFNQNQGLRQEFNTLPIVKNYSTVIQKMSGALRAPDTPQGDLDVLYAFATVMDPNSVVRESEQDMAKNTASAVAQLRQKYNMIQEGSRLPDGVRQGLIEAARGNVAGINNLYNQQRSFYADLAKRNGFKPFEVVGPHIGESLRPVEEEYIKQHGGKPNDPYGTELGADQAPATGSFHSEYDPALTAKLDTLIRTGAPFAQASALASQTGSLPLDKSEYTRAVQYAKQHPEYRKSLAEATSMVPTTGFQKFAASPAGAFLSGAGKAGTLGFGDEMVASVMPGDYQTNRDALEANQSVMAANHPLADLLGQTAGSFATGMGIGKGLQGVKALEGGMFGSKMLPNLLSKEAVAGDSLYGAGYGAGANNQDRLGGALGGAALGAAGGVAARGTVNGAAAAISPTGGVMRPLYDMGVRPSIGQRLGGVANNLEEKLQSIPIVGDAIAGTRDRARDQFQVGLFNDALGQIGQKLPQNMGPGHAPHAFAQDAISNAYDGALSNMNAVPDPQFGQDIGALQQKVGTLRPESQAQFSKIWDGAVGRRFKVGGGQLAGDNYKAAESEVSKKVSAIRSNPSGDHELAGALEDALGALRGSALRNSPPEAVQALNAADAAHARIVRLETASRGAGGEPAEFSPKAYNSAVRTASGGVRNRNYLRGDALNTDIAALGTRLGDKVSNSGSIDRLAAGMAATGAGYINPIAAGALGGLGAVNAPGIRNITTELMAPRGNPIFDRTADQLRQRARLAGMFGAPLAIDYFGQ